MSLREKVRYKYLASRHGHEEAARRFGVTVGRNCRVLSKIIGSEPWLITIGDHVTISTSVTLLTHDGSGWLVNDDRGRRYRYAPIEIGNDVFIGAGTIVMPGVRIGSNCVVGAGSVVTRSIPAGSVVAGVPARPVSDWPSLSSRMTDWAAESDLRGSTYRERVNSIVEDFLPIVGSAGREG